MFWSTKPFIFLYVVILTVLLGTTPISRAAEVKKPLFIHMSALNFPGVIHFNRKGAFDMLVEHLNQEVDIDMEYDVLLPARGARLFYQKEVDCVIPGTLLDSYYEGFDVVSTLDFSQVEYVAFTLVPNEKVTELSQLNGKIIGIVRGEGKWDMKQRLNAINAEFIELVDIKSMVGMLVKGRIDAIVHDSTGIIKVLDKFALDNVLYDINSPILVDKLGIVCHKNKRTIEYIQRINPEIKRFNLSSQLNSFYEKVELE